MKEKYDKLERLIRKAGSPPPGKETLQDFIDGKSEEETNVEADREATEETEKQGDESA